MAAGFRTVTAIHIHRLAPVLVALALCAATALEAAPVPELSWTVYEFLGR